jgi:hypothetical protein
VVRPYTRHSLMLERSILQNPPRSSSAVPKLRSLIMGRDQGGTLSPVPPGSGRPARRNRFGKLMFLVVLSGSAGRPVQHAVDRAAIVLVAYCAIRQPADISSRDFFSVAARKSGMNSSARMLVCHRYCKLRNTDTAKSSPKLLNGYHRPTVNNSQA